MNVRTISPADYRVTRWRNGAGQTAEIAVAPATGERFAWRVSIADVPEPGPFSDYAGYERIITVIEGVGMRLSVDGCEPVELTKGSEPYAFAGNRKTACELLAGRIRDFNLIYDPTIVSGSVQLVRLSAALLRKELTADTVMVHAVDRDVRVDIPQGGEHQIPARGTLRIDAMSGSFSISGAPGASALLVVLVHHDRTNSA